MQAAFFKVSEVIPYAKAVEEMKKGVDYSYGKKGEEIVKMNYAAIDRGGEVTKVEIPEEWAKIELAKEKDTRNIPEFIKNVMEPINSQRGDSSTCKCIQGPRRWNIPGRNNSLRETCNSSLYTGMAS